MKFFLTVNVFLFVLTSFGFSQNQDFPKKEKKVFLYSFENLTVSSQLDSLVAEVLKIKGVKEAKAVSKTEGGKGQLIFSIEQIITGNEDIEDINLIPVKNAILNNNLFPIECIERVLQK